MTKRILVFSPFLGALVLIYGVFAFGQIDVDAWLSTNALQLGALPSVGDGFIVLTIGDFFVIAGLLLLSIEIVKSTYIGGGVFANHGLSMAALLISFAFFLLVDGFGTTTFLILVIMLLVDVLVGMMLTTITARRDIGVGGV